MLLWLLLALSEPDEVGRVEGLLLIGGDEDKVYKALDAGDAATLKKYDTAELVKLIRQGRPVENGKTGEYTEQITDAYERTTDLIVKVPGGKGPYGVMIFLHGLGGNAKQLKDLCKKFAEENGYIIVCPGAQKEPKDTPNEDGMKGAMADQFPHWWYYREGNFVFTALSLVKKRYPIDENRIVLTGYSMGGFGTWNIGLRYPDRFAALVPLAGGISRGEYLKKNDDLLRPLVGNAYNIPIYFAHGDADQTVPVKFARKTRDQLKQFGYAFEYKEVPKGQHMLDVREGGELMNGIQAWLKPKKRSAHPKALNHYFVGDYCPRVYWVRVAKFADKTASVDAKINGQTIEIKSNAAALSLYIDETLLDLAKPITVVSGGKTLFEGKVEPSADVVLESWKGREDRELLFRAKIDVVLN